MRCWAQAKSQNMAIGTRKCCVTITFWPISLRIGEVVMKNMYPSCPVCTWNHPSATFFSDKMSFPFWSAGMVWLDSGQLPPSLFPTRKIPLLNDWFCIWLPSPTCCLFRLVPGVFDLDSCEVFLEFFDGLGSCWKVFGIPPHVLKFPNPLSVFSISLQTVLIFLQVAFFEPLLQKKIFLSFLIRSLELRMEITYWRFPLCLILPCLLLPLPWWYPPKLCPELLTVLELFFLRKNFCSSSELLLGVSDGPYWKGFYFFFPLSQSSSMVCFFDLAKVLPNLFIKQILILLLK